MFYIPSPKGFVLFCTCQENYGKHIYLDPTFIKEDYQILRNNVSWYFHGKRQGMKIPLTKIWCPRIVS